MNVLDRDGRRWSYPNQGAIMRANPDGSGFEVFASGLRNLQEFAFDEHGNLVGVDNDGDYVGEVERVVYVTYGSDSGWRTTWQYGKYTDPKNNVYNVWINEGMFRPRFDGQAAYITPPVAPGHSGPAGLAYDPGTALDDRYRGRFFVSSFTGSAPAGRIYAFGLRERGAGFDLASDTEILRGVLTVGVKIGTNGALFLSDWITGWDPKSSGRIWTLDAPAAASSPVRGEVRGLLASRFDNKSAADLRTFMGHPDMRVRQKAQFELVRRGDVENLLTVANDPRPLARIHAIWGLGQLARANATTARVSSANVAARLAGFLSHSDAELRAQTAKVLGDAPDTRQAAALVPLLADAAPRVRFFAAEALGRLRYAPATQALVQMLADNDDRDAYLRHAGSAALASIGDVAAIGALASHPSRGVRLAAVVALRRLHDPGVARFLDDADALVVTEAARAINDDGGIPGALPALARVLDRRGLTNEGLVRRAIAANARLGSTDAFARVTAFASSSDGTSALRSEASAALAVWSSPSIFDRVDGGYLGTPGSRATSATLSWLSAAAYWLLRSALGA
jgi:HEAT repeat protein